MTILPREEVEMNIPHEKTSHSLHLLPLYFFDAMVSPLPLRLPKLCDMRANGILK